jgi:hypothetical protein
MGTPVRTCSDCYAEAPAPASLSGVGIGQRYTCDRQLSGAVDPSWPACTNSPPAHMNYIACHSGARLAERRSPTQPGTARRGSDADPVLRSTGFVEAISRGKALGQYDKGPQRTAVGRAALVCCDPLGCAAMQSRRRVPSRTTASLQRGHTGARPSTRVQATLAVPLGERDAGTAHRGERPVHGVPPEMAGCRDSTSLALRRDPSPRENDLFLLHEPAEFECLGVTRPRSPSGRSQPPAAGLVQSWWRNARTPRACAAS